MLAALLDERVSIRDLPRICEALSVQARRSPDPEALVEAARATLGAAISAPYAVGGRLPVITIDPLAEQLLLESLRSGENGSFLAIAPADAEEVARTAARLCDDAERVGHNPVLVCSGPLRQAVRRLVATAAPRLPVLAYHELGDGLTIERVGVIDGVRTRAA